jgi:hypothetical protein
MEINFYIWLILTIAGDSIFLDFDRKMDKEKRYETIIPRKLIDCCKTLSNGGVI